MMVASVIASNANNVTNTYNGNQNQYINPVGIAYNAQIIPMLINGDGEQLYNALKKAQELDVDIINMSLGPKIGSKYPEEYYNTDLDKLIKRINTTGRGGKGTLVVVSSSNSDSQTAYNPIATYKAHLVWGQLTL